MPTCKRLLHWMSSTVPYTKRWDDFSLTVRWLACCASAVGSSHHAQVPEYVGTEIHKFHAKSHVVQYIRSTGCMVYTWNFANEGSLQRNKRIMEASNWKEEQSRLASFMSMRLARRSRQGLSGLDQSDRVQYVDVEPTNLMLELESVNDPVLTRLVAPTCFGAWEGDSIVKGTKQIGVGDWALCDCGGYESALIQVTRMVQVSLRDELGMDGEISADIQEAPTLHSSIRMQAYMYLPGIARCASRGGALSIVNVRNEGSNQPGNEPRTSLVTSARCSDLATSISDPEASSHGAQKDFRNESNYEAVRVDSEKVIITLLTIHRGDTCVTFQKCF